MKNFLLSLVLLFPVMIVQAQQTYETLDFDNSYYIEPWTGSEETTSPDQSLAWFVHLSTGEYRLRMTGKPNQKGTEFQLIAHIKPVENNGFKTISKEFTINKDEVQDFIVNNILIEKEAFYKIEIGGKELKGSGGLNLQTIALETPEGKGGKARFAKWKTSPSVHLSYLPDDEKKQEYDWLYGEILVPAGYDPMYTFWMCIGFYRGYFGIQVNSDTERRVLFSVWDSSDETIDRRKVKQESQVVLLEKNPEVEAGSFGNEGTGGQSYLIYNWKTGIPVKFLMNMRKLDNGFVAYSAWFMDKEPDGWKYIATWQAPKESRYFDGFYSFIENFGKGTGQMVRKGNFYNMWGRRVKDAQWIAFNKAKLTHTDGEPDSRSDYAGGISESDPTAFYMRSGGYTAPIDKEKILVAPKRADPPVINTDTLAIKVDKAIERKAYLDQSGIVPDQKVNVIKTEASEAQPGEDIGKSVDGNTATLYHSRWVGTSFPVTLTYFFGPTEQIDYLTYFPRTEGSNGNFKEVEVWVSTEANPSFVKTGDYDFGGASSPSKISFNGGLKKPRAIKFLVKSGMGDSRGSYASCAEMSFYIKSRQTNIPPIFSDETCSELKKDIDHESLDTIKNRFFKRLALALYENQYEKEFRIQEYNPYPHPEENAQKNKSSAYSLLDNPTGICINKGEELIVFVGNTGGENLSLRVIDFDKGIENNNWGLKSSTFLLNEGANKIVSDRKGLLYVMYHTGNAKAKPVKIHIATGQVNGYYNVAKHKPEDWIRLLDKAQDKYFDLLGHYAHLTFPVSSFRSYCKDGNRLIQVYDSISWLEQKFTGLYKYERSNTNRMYFHVDHDMPDGWGAYATTYRTAYPSSSLRELCDAEKLRSTDIWGPAHEVGHLNQLHPGFCWGGMGEVSNNVYAMYVQSAFGNRSRLAEEKLGIEDSIYRNRYEKGFTEILAAHALHSTHKDVFCKLIPFWQLELYYAQVKGQTDFYADVHEQLRRYPNPTSDSEAILAFIRICCDVSGEDLTDFFKSWGLLRAVEYQGNYEGYGSGSLVLSCTPEQVEKLVSYAKKYPKPAANLQYIHDDCVNLFQKGATLSKGSVKIEKNKVTLTDWKNAVVFEVYDKKQFIFVSTKNEFTIPASVSKPVIYAVPAKGKKLKITI